MNPSIPGFEEGEVVGDRYAIGRSLGAGGMGTLYLAFDTRLKREVAIKSVQPQVLGDRASRERFDREGKALTSVKSGHVVDIYDLGNHNGRPYLVMELLHGQDLAQRLTRGPGLSTHDKLEIAYQVCAGLRAVHAKGIVHRDIKPANIWLEPDGNVKLIDFGIARVAAAATMTQGAQPGSAPYMAPEQVRGDAVDHRADLFSVGIVLYELLSGVRPFRGEGAQQIMFNIVHSEPPSLDSVVPPIAPGLRRTLERALHKDPSARLQSAEELGNEIRRARGSHHDAADTILLDRAAPAGDQPSHWDTTTRRLAATGIFLAIMVIAGLAWYFGRPTAGTGQMSAATASPASAETSRAPIVPPAAETTDARTYLQVTSVPEGARIVVNDQDSGHVTPYGLEVDSTSQNTVVRLDKPGYQPLSQPVTTDALKAGLLELTLTAEEKTLVATGPYPFEILEGSRILSDAKRSHRVVVIPPRTLRFRADSYFLDEPIVIRIADPARIERQAPPLGDLRIQAAASLNYCIVSISGRSLGRTPPIVSQQAAAGRHDVDLACPDGRHFHDTTVVRANERVTVYLQ